MDSEAGQVSHLLSLAAAMSAAQEKATGNGKLDLAGIMAAMTMAQGGSRGVGGGGKIEEAIYSSGTSLVSNLNAGKNLIQGSDNGKLGEEEKIKRSVNDRKSIDVHEHVTHQSVKNKPFDSLKRESSSLSLFRSPKPYKKFEEPDAVATSLIDQSTDDNKLAHVKLPVTRANMNKETTNIIIRGDAQGKIVTHKLDEIWLEKVNSKNFNGIHKTSEAQYADEPSCQNLSDFLQASDPGIVQLMGKLTNMFATKEELTGNGRLDLSDLVVAVASIIQNDDTENKALAYKSISTNKAKTSDVQRGYTQTTPVRKTTTLTVNIGQNQSKGSVDWARKEAIKGAAVAKGVSADMSDVPEPQLSNAEPAADPAVRKLVYSQYRGMLKNYSSND